MQCRRRYTVLTQAPAPSDVAPIVGECSTWNIGERAYRSGWCDHARTSHVARRTSSPFALCITCVYVEWEVNGRLSVGELLCLLLLLGLCYGLIGLWGRNNQHFHRGIAMTDFTTLLTRLFCSPAYRREQSTYVRGAMELACRNAAIRRWNRTYHRGDLRYWQ
jgi:hypothetical protein